MWTLARGATWASGEERRGANEILTPSADAPCRWSSTLTPQSFLARCSFVVTGAYTVLCCIYAVDTLPWALDVSNMVLPLAGVCWVLAVMLRPKDEGRGIKIVHLQFIIFAFCSEVASAVGHFRLGLTALGWVALMRIPLWMLAYQLGLQLRKKAARLTRVELSNFLCYTVLKGSVGAMAPIFFFLFETISCITSDGLHSEVRVWRGVNNDK